MEKRAVPYTSNQDLPRSVREPCRPTPRTFNRSAFNAAWRTYGETDPAHIKEIAYRVAWAAVKRRYRKLGDTLVPRDLADD
jgi:cation transport regulator